MPNISVIITVYNRFELTKRAVESVLAQTLRVSEILLIDDGSFDGTSELLALYVADNPAWRDRVRYFHQENKGPSAARNSGIAQSKGEWLAFLDNDDLWLPEKLERQFRALDRFKGECDVCITDAWFMNNQRMKMTLFQLAGKYHDEPIAMIQDPLDYMARKSTRGELPHPVWPQNLVARADLVRRVGGFDPQISFGEDDDFAFRLGCETKFCVVDLPLVVIDRSPPAERHVGATEKWNNAEYRIRMSQLRLEKRLAMSERLPEAVQATIRRDLAAIHSAWANLFLNQGQYKNSKIAVSEALRVYPTSKIALKSVLIRYMPKLARKIASVLEERHSRTKLD